MHNTETALIRIMSYMLVDMDNSNVIFLALLDLSSAFDTVDNTIPGNRIEKLQGISGNALEWIKACLMDRSQRSAHGATSKTVSLECGLPRASCLGRRCVINIQNLILLLLIMYHFYTNYSQPFTFLKLPLNSYPTGYVPTS